MTTLAQPAAPAATESRHSLRKLPLAFLAAAALAALGNSVVRLITVAVTDIAPEFEPLRVGPPIGASIVSALAATVVFAVLVRFTKRPVRNFWITSLVAFVVTFAPLVNVATSDNPGPGLTGATAGAIVSLAVMHVVALAAIVPTLIRLTRTN